MKKLYTIIMVIVALLAISGTALADSKVKAKVDLNGSQENPPVATDMTGEFKVEIENGKLEFELEVKNNTHEIVASHIHCAAPGSNGPVGVTLFSGSFTKKKGTLAEGKITAPNTGNACGWADIDAVAAAIRSGNTYVNIHTSAASGGVPSGEIRGNLPGSSDKVKAKAELNGSQENPPVATDMTGEFKAEIENGTLAFELEVKDNTHDIAASHIHCAAPGSNGPVGVTLFSGSFTNRKGTLAEGKITEPNAGNACGWTTIADVAAAIRSGNTYVNVHTTAASGGVPSGEIRGLLRGDNDD